HRPSGRIRPHRIRDRRSRDVGWNVTTAGAKVRNVMDKPPVPRADDHPAEIPAHPRRRRWVRFLFVSFSAIVLLVVFAPQIVSWTSFRHELPRFRLPGFEEDIRVGRAWLSWWSPIELWDIELDAPDGQPFVKIAHVFENRSVWDLVMRPTERFHVRLEKLEVNA